MNAGCESDDSDSGLWSSSGGEGSDEGGDVDVFAPAPPPASQQLKLPTKRVAQANSVSPIESIVASQQKEDEAPTKRLRTEPRSTGAPNAVALASTFKTSSVTEAKLQSTTASCTLQHSFLGEASTAEDALAALHRRGFIESPVLKDARHNHVRWTIRLERKSTAHGPSDYVGVYLRAHFSNAAPPLIQRFKFSLMKQRAGVQSANPPITFLVSPSVQHTFHARDSSSLDQGFASFFAIEDIIQCWKKEAVDPARVAQAQLAEQWGCTFRVDLDDHFDSITLIQSSAIRGDDTNALLLAERPDDAGVSGDVWRAVGIQNQGATCYMNALLQTFFHLPAFSRALLALDTSTDNTNTSIALALQRVFRQLLTSSSAISTRKLTNAFGWSALDAFVQHDTQELARVLFDRLQKRLAQQNPNPSHPADFVEQLFGGQTETLLRCRHIDKTSRRREAFFDVQLGVPCPIKTKNSFDRKALEGPDEGSSDASLDEKLSEWSLQDALAKYTAPEEMAGDNQYYVDEVHGKQDAMKQIRFASLPPVLQFHLKRFQYDASSADLIKVNSHFAYPDEIDMSPFCTQDCAATIPTSYNAERGSSAQSRPASRKYRLFSVIVHQGSIYSGHYYAYVRRTLGQTASKGSEAPVPPQLSQWFCFNDAKVTKASKDHVFNRNFGLSNENRTSEASSFLATGPPPPTAYVLLYVRCDVAQELLRPLQAATDIPRTLERRFEAEEANERKVEQQRLQKHLEIHVHYFGVGLVSTPTGTEMTFSTRTGGTDWFLPWRDLDDTQQVFSETHCSIVQCLRTDTLDAVRTTICADMLAKCRQESDSPNAGNASNVAQGVELWSTCVRDNGSHRVYARIDPSQYAMTLEVLESELKTARGIYLFLSPKPSGHRLDATTKQPSLLLFLQRFTPKSQLHRHRRFWRDSRMDPSGLVSEGTINVSATTTVVELKRLLRRRHNIALDIGVQIFEVLTLEELNGLNEETATLGDDAELIDGDIICYQFQQDDENDDGDDSDASDGSAGGGPGAERPTLPPFSTIEGVFAFLNESIVISLLPLDANTGTQSAIKAATTIVQRDAPGPRVSPFVRLHKTARFHELAALAAESLALHPDRAAHLRFSLHNSLTNRPNRQPMSLADWGHSSATATIIAHSSANTATTANCKRAMLYYEILERSLNEVEGKLNVRIWPMDALYSAHNDIKPIELYVKRDTPVQELLDQAVEQNQHDPRRSVRAGAQKYQLLLVNRSIARVERAFSWTTASKQLTIRGSAATSCHLYMSPVDQDAVACPHNETGIASPHARPPLTLLVHFGFADHPARPTASNAESASTPSPLNIAFDGREPVAFSKMPIACYPHAGETTAEFRDRIKLPPGVDFGRPGVKETLSFVLLDKADRIRCLLRDDDVVAEVAASFAQGSDKGEDCIVRGAFLHPYFRAADYSLASSAQALTMRDTTGSCIRE